MKGCGWLGWDGMEAPKVSLLLVEFLQTETCSWKLGYFHPVYVFCDYFFSVFPSCLVKLFWKYEPVSFVPKETTLSTLKILKGNHTGLGETGDTMATNSGKQKSKEIKMSQATESEVSSPSTWRRSFRGLIWFSSYVFKLWRGLC